MKDKSDFFVGRESEKSQCKSDFLILKASLNSFNFSKDFTKLTLLKTILGENQEIRLLEQCLKVTS